MVGELTWPGFFERGVREVAQERNHCEVDFERREEQDRPHTPLPCELSSNKIAVIYFSLFKMNTN